MAKKKVTPKPKQPLTYGHGPKIAPGQSLQRALGGLPAEGKVGSATPGAPPLDIHPSTPLDASSWAATGAWVAVSSSNVAGISYDKESRTLYVEFQSGRAGTPNPIYEYYEVPPNVAQDMYNSSSMGSFVHQRLHLYGYKRIA